MKRGLKDVTDALTALEIRLATIAPMTRGLKATIMISTDLKRGLKAYMT